MRNSLSFLLYGPYALFSDPLTRLGGEKCSYHLPTYEALKGVVKSIYWKPTIIWHIDRLRVLNVFRSQRRGVKPLKYHEAGNELSIYSYLVEVAYQVEAHFEWNEHRPELAADRIDGKHYQMARRSLEKGGRQDIFLGTRDCQGYVEPGEFGAGPGAYDDLDELAFGLMFHGFDYPDESGRPELHSRFWRPVMRRGVIEFPRPDDQEHILRRFVRDMSPKRFRPSRNFRGVESEVGR
jgi:CRISPR-associated protein Cas5d